MADTSTRPNSTVYVGGLHPTLVTASVLSEAFIPFGEIADISLPKPELPSSTDLHRGFGYVEFEEAGDAKEAINNMDQSELYGKVIKVAMAKPQRKEDESGGLGSKTAIWEQVSLEERIRGRRARGRRAGLLICAQEGYLAEYAVSEEDRLTAQNTKEGENARAEDPMQELEELDTAGPNPE